MKYLHNIHSYAANSFRRPKFFVFVVAGTCLLVAFVLSFGGGNLFARANADPLAHASTASVGTNSSGYAVKVFFSQYPASLNSNSAVFAVERTSPTIAVATFSLQLLIAGPTLSERQAGYFTELNTILSGSSNCSSPLPVGGPDFTLTLDHRGPTPQKGTATVKFCRATNSGGIGTDARVTAEIDATLEQFSNIKEVVILTQDGHCFGDESGKDLCLQ